MNYPVNPLESPWKYDGTYQARHLALLDLIRIAVGDGSSGGATEATLELVRLLLVSLDGKDYATETTLASRLSKQDFEARINTLGQKTSVNSTPVVIASDQSYLHISGLLKCKNKIKLGNILTIPDDEVWQCDIDIVNYTVEGELVIFGEYHIEEVKNFNNFGIIKNLGILKTL